MINWNLVTPEQDSSPGREVASINGLLSALAERRQRAEQFAAQQDLHERELAQQTAHQAALEEYNRQTLRQQAAHQQALLDFKREAAKQKQLEASRKASQGALPGIWKAIQEHNEDQAGLLAKGVGGTAERYSPELQKVPELMQYVPPAPGEQPPQAVEPPPMPGAGQPPKQPAPEPTTEDKFAWLDELIPYAAARANAQEYNKNVLDATKGTFKVTLPGVPSAFIEDMAEANSRRQKGSAMIDEYARTYNADTPIKRDVLKDARGLVSSGALPPDKFAAYVEKEVNARENRAASERNAALQARARAASGEDTKGQRAQTIFAQSLRRFDTREQMSKLGEEYRALREAAHKATGEGMSQKGAVDALVASYKKGTVTAQSLQYIASAMGGDLAKLQGMIEAHINGKLGGRQLANLNNAIQVGTEALKEDVERKRKGFVEEMYQPGYYEMQGNADAEYNSRFAPFGYEPIRRSEGEGPAITPTGKRTTTGKGKKTAAAPKVDPAQRLLELAERLDKLKGGR